MIQTLRYTDEKSDKFWHIETAHCDMMINWGKIGTTGRYEIKEFDSDEDCEKQGIKLLHSKLKKGYQDMPEFNQINHFYFDTDDYGPHPLTSHPTFRTYFSDGLYYDCGDDEAPFGNDAGSDTLHTLEDFVRKRSKINFADFPRSQIEDGWELTYLPPQKEPTNEDLREQAAKTYNALIGEQILLQTDQVILAAAFGQIKVTGKLDTKLQAYAFLSLERMEQMYRLFWNWKEAEPPYNVAIMRRDLTKFTLQFQNISTSRQTHE